MAKGDDTRVRNAIDNENEYLYNRMNNVRFGMAEPLFNQSMADYGADRASDRADYASIMPGFQEFARTGGFSDEDKANLRSRAVAPIRSMYSTGQRELNRYSALSGGNLPGKAVLMARMNRDMNQGMSDASINAEASIADMVQRGRLAGLTGATQLYGTMPGRSGLASRNLTDAAGINMDLLRTDVGRGLGVLGERNRAAGIPGRVASTFSGIGQFARDIGQGVAGAVSPWAGGG